VVGRVRALIDDRGRPVKSAGPSTPVEVLGLTSLPQPGDPFQTVADAAKARQIATFRQARAKELALGAKGKDVSSFRGLGRTIPAYLAETGLLREGALLVHNVHLAAPEIDALRAGGARFVLCPRSNEAHGNGAPDVTRFVDAKIPFALGTDSLGSVPDLSPWSEMRAARALYKGQKKDAALCRELFRAVTENGAAALGLPGGILAPGGPADFTIVDDPGGDGTRFFKGLLEKTGRENVRLTAVAGRPAHGACA